MEFKVTYPKSSNLYLFTSDLSQWNNLTCFRKRKEEWIKLTGKLTSQEKRKLSDFSKILQNSENNLELVFLFGKKNTTRILKNKCNIKKIKELEATINVFKKRFDLVWKSEKKKLKSVSKGFNIKNDKIKNSILIIQKLCGLSEKQLPKKINLRLLTSGFGEYQGWSYKNNIILECSGWHNKTIESLYNIFLHELFHIFLKENKKLFNSFENIIKANSYIINGNKSLKLWNANIVFEEALISSFLPEGYLGQKIEPKILKNKKENIDALEKLRDYCQSKIFSTTKKYADNGKTLDKKYFMEIAKIIEKFVKENKEEQRI